MRVLILHSRYLTGPVSGENRVVCDEARLLRSGGHEVRVSTPSPEGLRGVQLLRAGLGTVWSRDAAKAVRRLVSRIEPDIVHCHNLFPMLSPSVLRAAADRVPIVMTLHNYRLLCLPATLLRDGQICELCVGRLPWRGVVYRCHRDSTAQSGALATSLGLHRAIGSFDQVDLNLAVSDFVRRKHVAAGFAEEQLRVKRNFAWESPRRDGPGDHFLFAGRLSAEKGLAGLLDLDWPSIGRLVVAGDGPEAERLSARAGPTVDFVGQVRPEEVRRLLVGARAVVVPSVWHEPAPRTILEAYAAGVPVIASRMGGLPEVVEDGVCGLLVPAHDPPAWAAALGRLVDDEESERLGEGAWRTWSERYSPRQALPALENAYGHAIAQRRTRQQVER